ncbi:MAG: IS5 family transposase [Chthoniobacterales bacterium]
MQFAEYQTDLTDFQWEILRPLLPKKARTGRPRTCLRRVVDAVLYMTKSGCPWRLLPKEFPCWKTVYHHFWVWSRSGLLETLHAFFRESLRKLAGKKKQPSAAVIDSQTVRAAAHGGTVGYDAGKKTKGRKRFLCVDTLGLILGVFIAPADTPERAGAMELLRPVLKEHRLKKIWADGGFTGEPFANWVHTESADTRVEIIRRCDSTQGFKVLPKRWVVERTFGWLHHQRRLVRDYEKTISSAKAFVFLAAIRIMLNQYS